MALIKQTETNDNHSMIYKQIRETKKTILTSMSLSLSIAELLLERPICSSLLCVFRLHFQSYQNFILELTTNNNFVFFFL